MNTIATKILKPGMIFSAPVYAGGDNVLVPAHVPLRQKDIDLLVAWDINVVSTEGTVINKDEKTPSDANGAGAAKSSTVSSGGGGSLLKEASKFSISEVQQNTAPYRAYKTLIEKLDKIFEGVKIGKPPEIRAVDNICIQLVQEIRDHRDSFIDFILGGEVSGQELAKSSVNTAVLSALTAQELKLPNHKILHIVTAALIHDVGMLRLPKEIVEKKGSLSPAELEQMKSHTQHSSKIISKEMSGPHEVNLIALQHHERWDGKGYPEHILGPAIDMGARIVSVADAFEAMVSKKSYRNSMMGYEAMKNLMADNSRRFDPVVIAAFTKIMGIYPIGSIVKLNSGVLARVIKVNNNIPLRPTIQILTDITGRFLELTRGKTIDLASERTLFIKNAINPSEYAPPS